MTLGLPTSEALARLPPKLFHSLPGDVVLMMNVSVVSFNDVQNAARASGLGTTIAYKRERLFPRAGMGGLVSSTVGDGADMRFTTDYAVDEVKWAPSFEWMVVWRASPKTPFHFPRMQVTHTRWLFQTPEEYVLLRVNACCIHIPAPG